MGDNSGIEWTDATWNPVTGCTQIPGVRGTGSGCDRCYAKTLIDTRQSANPTSVRFGKPFEIVMTHPERLEQPLRWRRPRRVFCNSLSDVFHTDVPDDYITAIFDIMAKAHWHTFQLLTKRAERMERFITKWTATHGVMPNLHVGVSVENTEAAWRLPHLRRTPAAVRYVSAEPLIGSLECVNLDGFDWIIVGGESGPGARPMQAEWARDVRDRCAANGTAYFFKQWGEWAPRSMTGSEENSVMTRVGKRAAGRLLDGITHDEYPATSTVAP